MAARTSRRCCSSSAGGWESCKGADAPLRGEGRPAAPHAYKDLLIFLALAGILAPILRRLKVSPILGFLIAGAAFGPQGLGRAAAIFPPLRWVSFGATGELEPLAELGVVFLLFVVGLELSWNRIWALRRLVFGLGAAQVIVCALAVGAAAAWAGAPSAGAAVIGAAAALSSTALVVPALAERKRLASAAGRAALAVLIAQDLAVAPILVSLGLLANLHRGFSWAGALGPLAIGAAALLAIVAAGRLLARPLFHSAALAKSGEIFAAASLLIVAGSAAAAAAGGLSMALGGLVAGLLLAETEFRREVEVVIEPFRGLLIALFFVSTGAQLDIDRLVAGPLPILAGLAAVVVIKAGATFGLGRLFGLSRSTAAETALPLATAGEFALVVLAQARMSGLIAPALADQALVAAGLGLFLTPELTALGARPGRRPSAASPPEAIPSDSGPAEGRVIVVGYGRVGQLVGDMLARHRIDYTAIDADPRLVARQRKVGVRIYFGDAARPAFLEACGAAGARAVVVTMDAPAKVDEAARAIRALRPDVTLIARARDARHAEALYRLGVTDAVPEAIEASLQLAENTLIDLGVPMGLVIASIHEKRDEFRERFSRSARRDAPVRALKPGPGAARDESR
ncbi:MAG TPA: cation:proton antiporter [Caulobacteraceae bacterium]|nr:cation:proton antiporter [Caulobacteraceae bacterium]